ncbi:MAG: helix-turn-helix transcriptional regulator [Phycisphaeraceae bacterium]|nr:helix-turn-helix transcriptional regulator [Phycisphaeraceae bacterium]MBX3367528.1 helix-turn-helix transcriptional regulator [Phycisphaeraceae bacterium]
MLNNVRMRQLTEATIRLHQASDVRELGQIAAESLRHLIPCDWPLVTLTTTHFPQSRHCFSTESADWQGYADRVLLHAHEDPVYTGRLRLLLDRPASPTEFVERNGLEKTEIYADVWRPLGARSIMRCLTPGLYNYRLEIGRSGSAAFDDSDAMVMQALADHLDAATDALVRRHAQRAPMGDGEVPVQRFCWLVCDDSGKILRTTERASRLMRQCLGERASAREIPAEWLAELRRRVRGHPPSPLFYTCEGCPVSVHIAPIRPTPNEFSVGFLERPEPADATARLVTLGLTRREAEVMRWMAEGKSNAAIGMILGISALTVKKHAENICRKIGADNRTTAVVIALEAMRAG